jgi:hypothetical protein
MITDISKSSLDAAIMISENSKIIIQTKQFNDYYFSSVDYLAGKNLCENLGRELFKKYNQEKDQKKRKKFLRNIISKFFKLNKPSSLLALPYGPLHFFDRLSEDFNQILDYAGLLDISSNSPSDEIIEWWDDLADFSRSLIDNKKIKSGRSGEKKTLEFEKKKLKNHNLNLSPTWDGFWDNKLGYDVKSWDYNKNIIFIEAKSSKEKNGTFFFTKNEWKCAISEKNNYFVYIWIQENLKPQIMNFDELKKRVIKFQEISSEGEQWEIIKINPNNKIN